ncbi:GNAT family N-acetyltransferase [Halopenitus persicus]|uniref:GNAT family N-acetyltransferase n=1 Tax=Halopenitus persicus TaxID=1048396 RepID=UPI0012FD62CA|nr:GNAT family N-acetyltransferase [Halopenitus persicus]
MIRLRTVEGDPPDVDALVGMYADFEADDRAQGIPPIGTDLIRGWLTGLEGIHVVADHRGEPVGHAVLVPVDGETLELAIFVHPDYQGATIGTRTLGELLDCGAAADATAVELHVERSNDAAIALYRKYGFTAEETRSMELRMRRPLVTPPVA